MSEARYVATEAVYTGLRPLGSAGAASPLTHLRPVWSRERGMRQVCASWRPGMTPPSAATLTGRRRHASVPFPATKMGEPELRGMIPMPAPTHSHAGRRRPPQRDAIEMGRATYPEQVTPPDTGYPGRQLARQLRNSNDVVFFASQRRSSMPFSRTASTHAVL